MPINLARISNSNLYILHV